MTTATASVATTILDQLTNAPEGKGINRINTMLGASNVRIIEDGVDFRFKGCKDFNYCRIVLNGDDLYDLMIGRLITRGARMGSVKDLGMLEVDAENLAGLFTKVTGLDTHL